MAIIKLFNSLTSRKETLNITNNQVSFYVCGPTVYGDIHIGNIRPIITFKLLEKLCQFKNYQVQAISNYTDIDDKIIAQARRENCAIEEISAKYIAAFEKVLKQMAIKPFALQPKVSTHIPEIIELIEKLLKQGHAYQVKNGDIYFDISKSPNYGQLINLKAQFLQDNASQRISQSKIKAADFALWKQTTDEASFAAPWGQGRPGWHSECVVMINKITNNQILDVHGGGIDLKFPHHSNEIAQSQALNQHHLAKIWLHNGFVQLSQKKMSKSLGNTVLMKDLLQKWEANTIKLFFLSTAYQKPISYSSQELQQHQQINRKLTIFMRECRRHFPRLCLVKQGFFIDQALAHLANNLNSPNALSVLFLAIKTYRKQWRNKEVTLAKQSAQQILAILKVLNLHY